MKFKHSEPLEVPPWKKRRRRGGRLRKTGKICGFDAKISPWGTAGWAASLWDPERFQNAPQDATSSDPAPAGRDTPSGSGRGAGAEKSPRE